MRSVSHCYHNGFDVVVGSFRGRPRPNRRKKGSVYGGFGRKRCFSGRRFGVKARRTRRKHRRTALRRTSLSSLTMFLGKSPHKKGTKLCAFTTMTSRSEDVVEEENNNDALWRLFRNAGGAFSGGVSRCRGETRASEI